MGGHTLGEVGVCAGGMQLHVVPGQVRFRWCGRCRSWSALEVGVYALASGDPPEPPALIGTFEGCQHCDPDLLAPVDDSPPHGGVNEEAAMTNPRPVPEPEPKPTDEDQDPQF